jgi:hypothetical protein
MAELNKFLKILPKIFLGVFVALFLLQIVLLCVVYFSLA